MAEKSIIKLPKRKEIRTKKKKEKSWIINLLDWFIWIIALKSCFGILLFSSPNSYVDYNDAIYRSITKEKNIEEKVSYRFGEKTVTEIQDDMLEMIEDYKSLERGSLERIELDEGNNLKSLEKEKLKIFKANVLDNITNYLNKYEINIIKLEKKDFNLKNFFFDPVYFVFIWSTKNFWAIFNLAPETNLILMILTIKLIFLGYKLKKEKLEIRAKKLSEYLNDTENYRKNGDKRLEAVSEFSNLATEITSCYFINFFPYVCILNHYLFFDKYSAWFLAKSFSKKKWLLIEILTELLFFSIKNFFNENKEERKNFFIFAMEFTSKKILSSFVLYWIWKDSIYFFFLNWVCDFFLDRLVELIVWIKKKERNKKTKSIFFLYH